MNIFLSIIFHGNKSLTLTRYWSFYFSTTLSMASPTSTTSSSTPMDSSLVSINAAAQLPLKLTPLNYFSWKAQFHALFYGLDLLGYFDGSTPCPSGTITTASDSPAPNPAHHLWCRQDQLILHAILASLSEDVMFLVASATTVMKPGLVCISSMPSVQPHILSILKTSSPLSLDAPLSSRTFFYLLNKYLMNSLCLVIHRAMPIC